MDRKRLFVTDLDGTLLDSQKKISSEDEQSIRQFMAAGGIFTVATGRTEETCNLATDVLPINAPIILYNGAAIVDLATNEVLYQKTLSAKDFQPLLQEVMTRFPDVCIEVFVFGSLLLVNPQAVMDPYILRENRHYEQVALADAPKEWLKIMFSAPNERLKEVQAFIESKSLSSCSMFFSADYYFEILPGGCSKGECVRVLADILGIDRADTAAIGDHLNDVEMLSWCGHGYTPANAHPTVKSVAHVLRATNDHSAVTEALRLLASEH